MAVNELNSQGMYGKSKMASGLSLCSINPHFIRSYTPSPTMVNLTATTKLLLFSERLKSFDSGPLDTCSWASFDCHLG